METFERWWSDDDYYQIQQGKQCHRKRHASKMEFRANDGRRGATRSVTHGEMHAALKLCEHTTVYTRLCAFPVSSIHL